MIPSNPIPEVPNYGSSAIYKDLPSPEQIRAGVIPLDSLPAAWWNAMWACTNGAVNEARSAVGTLINEVCNAITGAGICINESCIDQLYQAIETIRQRVGTAITAGAVKSSTTCGEVSIDANGIMTANGVGNASQLNTTSKVVVGAINELKSTYDCCFSDLSGCICSVDNSKAPTSHASANTTYGVGNATDYGHVKLSDEYTCCVGAAADGIAASQLALYCVYEAVQSAAGLGNTAACPLGETAQAGTASSAARSDHVHPYTDRLVNGGYELRACYNKCSDSRLYLYGYDTAAGAEKNVRVCYAHNACGAVVANCACASCCSCCSYCVNLISGVFCVYCSGSCIVLCNRCSFGAIFTPSAFNCTCPKSGELQCFMGGYYAANSKTCIGTATGSITVKTYHGIKVF